MILCPQFINHELDDPIMGATADVVFHADIKQRESPIRLGMVGKPCLVGIALDATLDSFGLWRLSHFSISLVVSRSSISTFQGHFFQDHLMMAGLTAI
jgi:hypothetical protein